MQLKRKAQTLLEYTVLIVIIIGVFIAMQNYIKRGIQGRWKSATDDLGDQYDPRLANSYINHVIISNSDTHIVTQPDAGGYFTNRVDSSVSVETKQGHTSVAAQGKGVN